MPPIITAPEWLEFSLYDVLDALPLSTPAWDVESYFPLYDTLTLVGGNRPIPGQRGRLIVPKEIDQGTTSLRMYIFGEMDLEGTPYADNKVGVRQNFEILRDNLTFSYVDSRPVVFHKLDGTTYSGGVMVVPPFEFVYGGPGWGRLVLNMEIPYGALT